jgi:orotidine-5'-phosphate decarboxylase
VDRVTAHAIVALDRPSLATAWALVEQLGDASDFYKVGSELYTAEGPAALKRLTEAGKGVFLDLKFHDIPNTVRSAARSAAALGARLISVHASGGRTMLEAAVEGAGPNCKVLAVTVLTSLDAASLREAWGRVDVNVEAEVMRLAELTHSAGAHGIVCGGGEVASVRAVFGDALEVLVPGVRLMGSATDDQRRIVTPGEAVQAGARYVVLGRTVTGSPDVRRAMLRAWEEIRAWTP